VVGARYHAPRMDRIPRRRRLLLVPLAIALVAAAVVATTQILGRGSVPASRGPVAVVGGVAVPAALFDTRVGTALAAIRQAGGAPQPGQPAYPAFLTGVKRRVLGSLIIDQVIAEEAAYRHLAATDAQVAAEVSADARDAGGADRLQRQLADAGGSLAQLRDAIRSRLNEERLEDLFASQRAADAERRLDSGLPFDTMAHQLSDDEQSRDRGGNLGALNLAQLAVSDASLAAAVGSAPAGRVSAPIRDDAGYEILRVDAASPTTRTVQRILVAAPRPYTVRERPGWFAAAVFQAIADDCRLGRLRVLVDVGLDPCAGPTAGGAAPGAASTPGAPRASPGAGTRAGTGTGFTPRR
jgi:SurA N-terminal domain/PPIC-type PPIASE domain